MDAFKDVKAQKSDKHNHAATLIQNQEGKTRDFPTSTRT
jgi:hypothetical protein